MEDNAVLKRGICLLLLSLTCNALLAQEKGKTGIAIAYPTTVGLLWHGSNNFALRPEFSFSRSTIDNLAPSTSSSTSNGFAMGLSALFYLHRWDNLSAYITPRFAYIRNTQTGSTTPSTSTNLQYTYSGSFGLQYALSRRISITGELGYALADLDFKGGAGTFQSRAEGLAQNIRSGVGLVFYLN